jgi:predicted DNA-binding transcriptional regulator YafY
MSGMDLAQRLKIDRRTVRRYIAMLEEIGIPITAERGRDGAYSLVSGFKLPPMMFTDDEALALSVGLLAARNIGLAEAAPAVVSAQAKLERVMPTKLKKRVRAIDETVTLELARPTTPSDNAALIALSAAALSQQRVRLNYLTHDNKHTQREFDPYGLVYRGGRWYAIGMCHLRKDLRSFRLDRVQTVEPSTINFTRPPKFDALEHLNDAVAKLPRTFATEVVLKTDLATAKRELFRAAGTLEQTAEGVLLKSQVDDLDWLARELSRLPIDFEVKSPDSLRDAVRNAADRLKKLAQ